MANFLTNCVTSFSGIYQVNKDANKGFGVEGTKYGGLAVLSCLSSKRKYDNSGIRMKIQLRSSLLCKSLFINYTQEVKINFSLQTQTSQLFKKELPTLILKYITVCPAKF
jgi:hypothetical protein